MNFLLKSIIFQFILLIGSTPSYASFSRECAILFNDTARQVEANTLSPFSRTFTAPKALVENPAFRNALLATGEEGQEIFGTLKDLASENTSLLTYELKGKTNILEALARWADLVDRNDHQERKKQWQQLKSNLVNTEKLMQSAPAASLLATWASVNISALFTQLMLSQISVGFNYKMAVGTSIAANLFFVVKRHIGGLLRDAQIESIPTDVMQQIQRGETNPEPTFRIISSLAREIFNDQLDGLPENETIAYNFNIDSTTIEDILPEYSKVLSRIEGLLILEIKNSQPDRMRLVFYRTEATASAPQ